ncbi:hypothetical protein DDT52_19370 [Brenneria roseae subsp. roseae]|uniref:DKNYY domain-containing protein n=1 Tax=Brenneria roseae TaxID=1509241 RepID=UPI000D61CE98|nr:DKNYY domain-containing protein [Brenneria roseae]PWC16189.1 hypothetical protein DDT52_19370 [Brenneria roseae subsp. roseae]
MKKSVVIGAMVALAGMMSAASHAEVKYPYKNINGQVVFQLDANAAPAVLEGAKTDDFTLLYKGDMTIAVARSDGHFYCNGALLPQGFDPGTAKVLDTFLLTNVGAYSYCKLMPQPVDGDHFEALEFPFFSDGKHIFIRTGEVLKQADAASFKTPAVNQAYDKAHYFFIGEKDIVLPYQRSVNIYSPCRGWASIDDQIHYMGEKRPDVDAGTLRCLTFSNAVSKAGFYVFGKLQPFSVADVKVQNVRPWNDNEDRVFTDGSHVWFVNVDAQLLEGVNSKTLSVENDYGDYVISDGVNKWKCGSSQTVGEPACRKT